MKSMGSIHHRTNCVKRFAFYIPRNCIERPADLVWRQLENMRGGCGAVRHAIAAFMQQERGFLLCAR
jgi:hypothetical protein